MSKNFVGLGTIGRGSRTTLSTGQNLNKDVELWDSLKEGNARAPKFGQVNAPKLFEETIFESYQAIEQASLDGRSLLLTGA